MTFFNPFKYSSLASRSESFDSHEEDQHLVDQHSDLEKTGVQLPPPRYRSCSARLLPVLPWAVALVSTSLLSYNVFKGPGELACTRLLNPYSPAIEDGVVEYYDTDFENEFAHKTKYRGPPTPELEEAWNQIWDLGGIEVPKDGPARLGKAAEDLVHVNSDDSRGYTGMLEVFHQLHCLNLIRQYTWKDYYSDHLGDWMSQGNNREKVDLTFEEEQSVGDRMHVDHCIETLRLQLMCNGDMTPMLVLKDDSRAIGSKADFNVHHTCRNWDKIVEWQMAHSTDPERINKTETHGHHHGS